MAVQTVVRVLAMYVEGDMEKLRQRYGPQAVAAAGDMADLVAARLERDSAHVSIWDAFERAPNDHIAELMGTLEAQFEADPGLARRLDAFVAEIEDQRGSSEWEERGAEAYMVGAGRDPLDYAVTPDAVDTEEMQGEYSPYHPEALSDGTDYDASVDRGTYLYGNVKAGVATVGEDAGVQQFNFSTAQARSQERTPISGLPGLLEQLRSAVADHQSLDGVDQQDIRGELDDLRAELEMPDAADPVRLMQHLEALHQSAPDVAEVVMRALAASELPPAAVEDAVERVRPHPSEKDRIEDT